MRAICGLAPKRKLADFCGVLIFSTGFEAAIRPRGPKAKVDPEIVALRFGLRQDGDALPGGAA